MEEKEFEYLKHKMITTYLEMPHDKYLDWLEDLSHSSVNSAIEQWRTNRPGLKLIVA